MVVTTAPDTYCFCGKPDLATGEFANYVELKKARCNGTCRNGTYPITTSIWDLRLDLERCHRTGLIDSCLCVNFELLDFQFVAGSIEKIRTTEAGSHVCGFTNIPFTPNVNRTVLEVSNEAQVYCEDWKCPKSR